MEQLGLIKWVVERLEAKSIPYFITGSIASSFYGIPRYTHDVDIVVTVEEEHVEQIIKTFGKHGYISKEGVLEALSGSGMFNLIHTETGLKVDFWINKGDPFTKSCFDRARRVEIADGLEAVMASAEDVLLHKIYWDHIMSSERQIQDAQGIIAVQAGKLDKEYIRKWATKMGIQDKVESLLSAQNLPNLT
ncbi:MAG: nucleotidyltransferase [Deltaproteobacteria bacterium]|nr:nucleotidyltransferase [Deltaproteobacteria bacterium]